MCRSGTARVRLDVRDHAHVARIGGDVVDQDRPLLGDGGADESLADLQAEVLDDVLGIADGVGDAQIAPAFVEQIDGEHA